MSDTVMLVIMIVAAVSYYGAFLLYLVNTLSKKRTAGVMSKIPMLCWSLGAVANLVIILNNYFLNGYVPFVSMFQVLTFVAICFLPAYLFMTYVCGCKNCGVYFTLASAIVMTGPIFMRSGSVWTFPPALQSIWFVPHILMYMLAYTLGTVSFLMTIAFLISKNKEIRKSILACARIAFPFMTSGMLFGAIWADQIWGAFWSWDLKECWALITWLVYMLLLHFARREKLQKWVPLLSIIGFICIIITMFFVRNMVSAGTTGSMHTYS